MHSPDAIDRLSYRYPAILIDSVLEHDHGRRIVAVKNVTVAEESRAIFPARAHARRPDNRSLTQAPDQLLDSVGDRAIGKDLRCVETPVPAAGRAATGCM